MKITETKTRDCCALEDLKYYKGIRDQLQVVTETLAPKFCIHCGQIFIGEWESDPSDPEGGSWTYIKHALPFKEQV